MRTVTALLAGVLVLTGCTTEAAVEYTIEPGEVEPGENPVTTLTNTGGRTVEYGNQFTLERKDGDSWKPVKDNVHCLFTMEAYLLDPGESKSQEIAICGRNGEDKILEVGLYRVAKYVHVPGDGEPDEIITTPVTFRVLEP